ncbi:WD repeat-containing protein 21 [Madurella mycetomatis]|uniref:WD repeat-containing protein 21 n=1 Tax=Madurella mycetomatis TaxID=100816 RepID=A0A175VXW4_9PEZI|nr:WD repeat-containing protein 21 [Madurella mycetomatis]
MQRKIPGYFYDNAKRRYFRIENDRTAPAGAAWSLQNVKRRISEEEKDAARQERLRRNRWRVKRATVWRAPLLGAMLAREAGIELGDAEAPVRAWTEGLGHRGDWRPWPELGDTDGTVSAMWIGGGDERSGIGVAYAGANRTGLSCSYIPRDQDDQINFEYAAQRFPGIPLTPMTHHPHWNISWLKFHEPSHKMLMGYRIVGTGMAIRAFSPRSSNLADTDLTSPRSRFMLPGNGTLSTIHSCQPAPTSNSRLTCVFGTEQGVAQLQDGKLSLLAPLSRPQTPLPYRTKKHKRRNGGRDDVLPWQADVLAVDFLTQNPAEVILAGTRSSEVCVLDLRTAPASWSVKSNTFRHASSVAHIKSVGGYEVLAAGPRSKMCLYDVRFLREQKRPSNPPDRGPEPDWGANATKPVLEFPSYQNGSYITIGLDVLTEGGYGSGLVAAAHDDQTVGVYSLRDGNRVAAGGVDKIRAPGVVKSLMWSAFSGDRHPSLFVGEGFCVKKYSFFAGESE